VTSGFFFAITRRIDAELLTESQEALAIEDEQPIARNLPRTGDAVGGLTVAPSEAAPSSELDSELRAGLAINVSCSGHGLILP